MDQRKQKLPSEETQNQQSQQNIKFPLHVNDSGKSIITVAKI